MKGGTRKVSHGNSKGGGNKSELFYPEFILGPVQPHPSQELPSEAYQKQRALEKKKYLKISEEQPEFYFDDEWSKTWRKDLDSFARSRSRWAAAAAAKEPGFTPCYSKADSSLAKQMRTEKISSAGFLYRPVPDVSSLSSALLPIWIDTSNSETYYYVLQTQWHQKPSSAHRARPRTAKCWTLTSLKWRRE